MVAGIVLQLWLTLDNVDRETHKKSQQVQTAGFQDDGLGDMPFTTLIFRGLDQNVTNKNMIKLDQAAIKTSLSSWFVEHEARKKQGERAW